MNTDDDERAREATQILGTEAARAHNTSPENTKDALPTDPENLTDDETRLVIAASGILDLRNADEIWRFLRCVEGITVQLGMTRTEVVLGICAGDIAATNGWIEDGMLEVRHYMPKHKAKQPRRERRPIP